MYKFKVIHRDDIRIMEIEYGLIGFYLAVISRSTGIPEKRIALYQNPEDRSSAIKDVKELTTFLSSNRSPKLMRLYLIDCSGRFTVSFNDVVREGTITTQTNVDLRRSVAEIFELGPAKMFTAAIRHNDRPIMSDGDVFDAFSSGSSPHFTLIRAGEGKRPIVEEKVVAPSRDLLPDILGFAKMVSDMKIAFMRLSPEARQILLKDKTNIGAIAGICDIV